MSHWLSIFIATACWLWALAQVRMAFVYAGVCDSPAIGFHQGVVPNSVMRAMAVRAAITFAIFGFVAIYATWPKFLTYVTAVWTIRGVIDVFLCVLGQGQYRMLMATATPQGRRAFVVNTVAKAVGNALTFGICSYFFGM